MPKGEHNRKLSDAQRVQLVERYTTPNADGTWDGCTTIAREFGVSQKCVARHLRIAGVVFRDNRTSHGNGKRCKPIVNLPTGDAPLCKCGCGQIVAWNRRRNRWNVYVVGHYRQAAPYKEEAWLRREYETNGRPATDIAAACGVYDSTVRKFLRKFGIPIRSQAESLILSGAVRGPRNAAWKGGISTWAYTYDWKRIARRIRQRDHYTCQMCAIQFPKTSKLLHVHHKDSDRSNNVDDNLVALCAQCHPQEERRVRQLAHALD